LPKSTAVFWILSRLNILCRILMFFAGVWVVGSRLWGVFLWQAGDQVYVAGGMSSRVLSRLFAWALRAEHNWRQHHWCEVYDAQVYLTAPSCSGLSRLLLFSYYWTYLRAASLMWGVWCPSVPRSSILLRCLSAFVITQPVVHSSRLRKNCFILGLVTIKFVLIVNFFDN